MVALLLKYCVPESPQLPSSRRESSDRIQQVRSFLMEKFTENISLEELAALVALSPFRLNCIFSQEVGIPPHAFLTQVRVWHAKKQLARGIHKQYEAVLTLRGMGPGHGTGLWDRAVEPNNSDEFPLEGGIRSARSRSRKSKYVLPGMKVTEDAYGQQLLAQYHGQTATAEFIERDDDYIDTGSEAGQYFFEYEQWSPLERLAIERASGRVLDIGCGAGRHSLYLQQKGFDVTAIDNSPGAIEVCTLRGLKNAIVKAIANIDEFEPNSFDTVLMFGNNFGLFGDAENAKLILKKLSQITSSEARIIAGTRNPYRTNSQEHLEYHEFNQRRGRLPGQIRIRVRYGKAIGSWFDYLFVAPEEMQEIVADTEWQIEEFIEPEKTHYFALISKKSIQAVLKQ
ncbi:MAG: methyltransferase domain-containing protein [Cyanobacteria bacterium J06606_4]